MLGSCAAGLTIRNPKSAIRNRMSGDPIFTLRDLETWSRPGTSLAVFGHPIKHSISPAMHNAALQELAAADGSYRDWAYFRFDIPPDDLPRALEVLHARRFRGVNLTVPHKVIAFDCVAHIDDAARPIGAVNTLRWSDAGWQGFNTDGYGLATSVQEMLQRKLTGSDIVLLGAGGAARGAAVECLQRGCASLHIANRTRANLDTLLASLAPVAGSIPVSGFAPATPPADLPSGAIVINATSAGLRDGDPMPIDLSRLPRPAAVVDMIYNPPQTPLLRAAAALGIPHTNGLAMLVHQGAKALEIWTGVPAPRTAPTMFRAARRALEN
jgi:shikimate dehydrogenase